VAAGIEQSAVVMLAVDLDEQRAELADQGDRHGLVVDQRAAAAVRLDDPAEDERLSRLALEAAFGEEGKSGVPGRKLEGDPDHRLGLTAADEAAVGAGAERESERVEKDRLAGPGLAGQNAEARPEFEVEALDQDDVADGEAGQHGLLVMPAKAGIHPALSFPPPHGPRLSPG
jgi:hypothetical protein